MTASPAGEEGLTREEYRLHAVEREEGLAVERLHRQAVRHVVAQGQEMKWQIASAFIYRIRQTHPRKWLSSR